MELKTRVKHMIQNGARRVGVGVHLVRIAETDCVLMDRNELQSYNPKNDVRLLYDRALARTGLVYTDNFWKQCRFYTLAQVARMAAKSGLEGEAAECGCWKGTSSYIIASTLQDGGYSGPFHIFDSFEQSLSEFVAEDFNAHRTLTESQVAGQKDQFVSTEAEVLGALAEFPSVRTYPGFIPARFSEVEGRKFFFVHIDVDLYQPTADALDFFHTRLVEGGFIAFDDYGSAAYPGAKLAIDQYLAKHPPRLFYESPTGGAFLVK